MEKYLLVGALAVAAVGAAWDVRGGRIPNLLTYSGLLSALIVRSLLVGWPGLKSGLIGLVAAGGVFYILFLVGGMGGGDVKLMAAVGAWAGTNEIVVAPLAKAPATVAVLIATALAGGLLALIYMLFHGRVRSTLVNTLELIRHHLQSGLQPHPELNIREQGTVRVPYGVAIAAGTLYCLGQVFVGR